MRRQSPAWWVGGLALLLSVALSARGQSTFQNLNFEAANIPNGTQQSSFVPFASALPGWTGLVGGGGQAFVLYDAVALSSSVISIIDSNASYLPSGGGGVIEGNYTVILQGGVLVTPTTAYPANTTLSQTGLVPAAAQSLLFKAYSPDAFGTLIPLAVTLGGQQLSYTALGSGANYTLYGADIAALAGQTDELDFTVPGSVNMNYVFLDSIQFSNLPIPEPGVFELSVLGALVLGGRVLGRRRNGFSG